MRNPVGHRRSIRMAGYDYASAGTYFITICTQDRACVFGDVVDGEMQANPAGEIVRAAWAELPSRYANVELDAFAVMPNHVHGIIVLVDVAPGQGAMNHVGMMNHEGVINHARTTLGEIGAANARAGAAGVPPLGEIVRAFKAVSARRIRQQIAPGAVIWQRNYYESIVRDDESLERVRAYVQANPRRWLADRDNPNPIHGIERRPNHD